MTHSVWVIILNVVKGYSTGNSLYNTKTASLSSIPVSTAATNLASHGGVVSTSYPSSSTPLDTSGHPYQTHNSGLFRYITHLSGHVRILNICFSHTNSTYQDWWTSGLDNLKSSMNTTGVTGSVASPYDPLSMSGYQQMMNSMSSSSTGAALNISNMANPYSALYNTTSTTTASDVYSQSSAGLTSSASLTGATGSGSLGGAGGSISNKTGQSSSLTSTIMAASGVASGRTSSTASRRSSQEKVIPNPSPVLLFIIYTLHKLLPVIIGSTQSPRKSMTKVRKYKLNK